MIISENTVRNHISHIMDKLDMTRRAQAAAYAARQGIAAPQSNRQNEIEGRPR